MDILFCYICGKSNLNTELWGYEKVMVCEGCWKYERGLKEENRTIIKDINKE
jgi:hypothetical protein